jgi:glycosyltransferase involved in cell wall biosynthesis
MAEGFAMQGHDVTLVCRAPAEGIQGKSALEYQYALHAPMRWVQLSPSRCGRALDPDWDFAWQLLPRLLCWRPDFVFSRNYIAPWLSSFMGIPTVAESHAHPVTRTKPFNRFIKGTTHRQFKVLVTIAQVLRDNFAALGVPKEKILVLPDAVDLHNFLPPEILPVSPYTSLPNVVYAGHLYDYKGIPDIVGAASLLPEVAFHLIGGLADDIQRVQSMIAGLRLTNIVVHGHKPRTELPPYLWHADALLLPPSAKHPSAQFTSPVKLGEYLASGRPLISSDISALRTWITEEHTNFILPDNPESLAEGIRWVLTHRKEASALAVNGQKLSRTLSYSQRAKSILAAAGV